MQLYEKIVLVEGGEVVIFNPHYSHMIEHRVLVGRALDDNGNPVDQTVVVPPENIAYTVAVVRLPDGSYEEDRSVVPPSLR